MGKMSRDKGKVFERQVANDLSAVLGPGIQRTYGQSREGHDAPDVDGPGLDKWWIECCHAASPQVFKKWEQAVDAADTAAWRNEAAHRTPLLIIKKTHGPTLAVMDYEKLLEVLQWQK